MSPGEKAGMPSPLLGIFEWLPGWAQPFWGLLLTLGLWLALRLLVEHRRPRLEKQYKTLWPGDLMLGSAFGLTVIGLQEYVPVVIYGFWQTWWWQALCVLAGLAALFGLAVPEYASSLRNRAQPKPWTYTLYQLHTPTCLGHRLSLLTLPYLLLQFGAPAFVAPGVPLWLEFGIVVLLAGWIACQVRDNVPRWGRPDLDIVHPRRNAWFPLFTRGLRWLSSLRANRHRPPISGRKHIHFPE